MTGANPPPGTTAAPKQGTTTTNPVIAPSLSDSPHSSPVVVPPINAGSDSTLATLPSPLIALLLVLAGPLRVTKKAIEVLMWESGSPVDSWLVVLCWWAVCLGGKAAYKYVFPPILLLLIPFPTSTNSSSTTTLRSTLSTLLLSIPFHHSHPQPPLTTSTSPTSPATSHTVLVALSDLYAINAMMARFPVVNITRTGGVSTWVWGEGEGKWWAEMERNRLIRGGMIIWTAWAAVNWFLGARVTLALLGSFILLAPSPTLKGFQQLLAKSLFLRRLATTVFLVVFGSPPDGSDAVPTAHATNIDAVAPSTPFSLRLWLKDKWATSRRPSFALRLRPPPAGHGSALTGSAIVDEEDASDGRSDPSLTPCPPVYFRFELQENQRWWMGLDWTSALLPQERPSWCDVYLNPVSPPSSFVLPSESVMYLPVPGRGGDARTKRTARWRWLDEDWTVIRRTGAAGTTSAGKDGPKEPVPGHEKTGSSASVDATDIHPSDVFTDQNQSKTTKGLAEQAFVKGLEKLKARNILGSGPSAGQQGASVAANQSIIPPSSPTMASQLAASVGFGSGSSPVKTRGSLDEVRSTGSRASFHEDSIRRRESSASADLSTAAQPTVNQGQSSSTAAVGAHSLAGTNTAAPGGTTAVAAGLAALMQDLDVQTDADGWSYGDNKWEGMGPKGGLGKYTRRRRWQRRAICTETVEYIPASNEAVGNTPTTTESKTATPKQPRRASLTVHSRHAHPHPAPPVLADVVAPQPIAPAAGYSLDAPSSVMSSTPNPPSAVDRKLRTSSVGSERDQALRQRLKNAMGSVGA